MLLLKYLLTRKAKYKEKLSFVKNIKNPNVSKGDFNNIKLFKYQYSGLLPICNLGDYIQTIAVEQIINKLYPSKEKIFVDRENLLLDNDVNKSLVIMQGWFSHKKYTFMPNKNHKAIWIGAHFNNLAQETIEETLKINPKYFDDKEIGCRDFYTLEFCKKLGIRSYLSRCLTTSISNQWGGGKYEI